MSPTSTTDATPELRFEFGKNWASFAATLDEAKIREAESRLASMLGPGSLKGVSFLDIGCGSGLHSLAALRMGAARVWAIDLDPNSVGTALAVLARWWPQQNYRVERKSVFELESELPEQFDIVYSWGVLHHTGEMVRAIRAACRAVKPGGKLAVALYGKTRYCGIWTRIKRWYVQATPEQKKRAEDWYVRLFGVYLLLRGQRLSRHIANYRRKRGMDFYHDVRDWIGGYPYESIRPRELHAIVKPLGFELEKQTVKRRSGLFGSGNDEYVFRKTSSGV
jgi:2-polyprenyl-6-hydroxyphenyl methylase/3-demethylubiquinone-9 3-methyltransferase